MTFWWVGKVLSHTVPIFGDISYGRVVFFRFLLEQLDILRFQSNVPWWLGEPHPVLPWSSETQMSSWPGWPGWPLFSFRFRFPDHVHPCSISNFQPWRVPSPKICLRVWIEQPVFFRTTWCLMSPGYDQRCHFFYFFWLVLMSQKVIALIHHASSGHWMHWIPISVDQVVLHAGPSTETNLEPSRWLWENDPHGPQSNRHGMSWFMLFHAGVFTYFYKHCFLLIHA